VRRTAFILPALALACGEGEPAGSPDGGGGPPSTCPIPTPVAAPTFSANVLPMLQATCGSLATSCHGGATAAGHVQYATGPGRTAQDVYADLVNASPSNAPAGFLRVKPGDPAQSWLFEKVTKDQPGGAGYGARMPYGLPNLCQPTVDTLASWITQQAPF